MKTVVSPFQIFLLHFFGILATLFVFTPAQAVRGAGQDAWIVLLGGGAAGSLMVIAAYLAMLQLRGKTLVAGLEVAVGRLASRLLLLPLLAFLLLAVAVHLSATVWFLHVGFLPVTPPAVLIGLIAICGGYMAAGGLEVVARFHEAIVVTVTLFVVIVLLPLSPAVDLGVLLPVLADGLLPVAQAAYASASPYFELVIFLFCATAVKPTPRLLAAALGGVWTAALLNAVWMISALGVFGPHQLAHFTLPYLTLLRAITIGEFFERVESVATALWLFSVMARTGLLVYMSAALVHQLLDWRRALAWPVTWVAVAGSLVAVVAWPSLTGFFHFLSSTYPLLGAAALAWVTLLLAVLYGRRLMATPATMDAPAAGGG